MNPLSPTSHTVCLTFAGRHLGQNAPIPPLAGPTLQRDGGRKPAEPDYPLRKIEKAFRQAGIELFEEQGMGSRIWVKGQEVVSIKWRGRRG